MLGPKRFWFQNNLALKQILTPQTFWVKKIVVPRTCWIKKKHLIKKDLGFKILRFKKRSCRDFPKFSLFPTIPSSSLKLG